MCLTYKDHFDSTEIKSVFDYAKKVFSSVIKKYSITLNSDKLDIVKISSDAQTFDFSMSVKDRIQLYLNGKAQAIKYFQPVIDNLNNLPTDEKMLPDSIDSLNKIDEVKDDSVKIDLSVTPRLSIVNEKKQNENNQIEKNKVD